LDPYDANRIANEEVDFLPVDYVSRMDSFLEKIGKRIIPELKKTNTGAPTASFKKASNLLASPIGGQGYIRLGEDGKVYLTTKSEHYHTPLGHNFPGYKLIDNARALGITNATHNNTRGYITRFLERELVRTVNGIKPGKNDEIENLLSSEKPHVLNRVINLETGSIACEAGIKMMLARFYQLETTSPQPKYGDRIPVFFVMADLEDGAKANYHGTSIFAQVMRDMWPGMYEKIENAGILKVCPVRINDF